MRRATLTMKDVQAMNLDSRAKADEYQFPDIRVTPDIRKLIGEFKEADDEFIRKLDYLRDDIDGPTKPSGNMATRLDEIEAWRESRNLNAFYLALAIMDAWSDAQAREEPRSRVYRIHEAHFDDTETALAEMGYERHDGDTISVSGVHIGSVWCKFDHVNMAHDFVILSVVEHDSDTSLVQETDPIIARRVVELGFAREVEARG